MRDFLENAEKHRDESSPEKTRRGSKSALPKRFYKAVSLEAVENSFEILLDGRRMKTPGKNALELPTKAAAELVSKEWESQEEYIDPLSMPVTRIVNTAIDGVRDDIQAVFEDILRFAGNDLVCYRSGSPVELVNLSER